MLLLQQLPSVMLSEQCGCLSFIIHFPPSFTLAYILVFLSPTPPLLFLSLFSLFFSPLLSPPLPFSPLPSLPFHSLPSPLLPSPPLPFPLLPSPPLPCPSSLCWMSLSSSGTGARCELIRAALHLQDTQGRARMSLVNQ